jgi:hypothetical protein
MGCIMKLLMIALVLGTIYLGLVVYGFYLLAQGV